VILTAYMTFRVFRLTNRLENVVSKNSSENKKLIPMTRVMAVSLVFIVILSILIQIPQVGNFITSMFSKVIPIGYDSFFE
jgi:hypothetical protein